MTMGTRRIGVMIGEALLRFLAVAVLVAGCGQSAPSPTASAPPVISDEAAAIVERLTLAWRTGETADVETAYARDAVLIGGDRSTVAADRDALIKAIQGSLGFGNTWRRIGQVSEYPASFGRLYLLTLFEVTGPMHENGDPIVVLCVARDGQVVRQLMIDPKTDL